MAPGIPHRSAGAAIDGYFAGRRFASATDSRSPQSIAAEMRFALETERELKAEIAEWQQSDDAKRFSCPEIAKAFARGLDAALGAKRAQD